MWYTIWRKLNSSTYRFYMAAEVMPHHDEIPSGEMVITKTRWLFNSNFIHADDLAKYPQVKGKKEVN